MKHSTKNKSHTKNHTGTHSTKNTVHVNSPHKKKHGGKFLYTLKRFGKNLIKKLLLSSVFQRIVTGVVVLAITGACFYGIYRYFNSSLANDVIVSQSEIIDRVAKLTALPEEKPEAIVRVEDAETLKKQNIFYENVKIGDYVIMYSKVAVIYDLRNNTIIAIKKSE